MSLAPIDAARMHHIHEKRAKKRGTKRGKRQREAQEEEEEEGDEQEDDTAFAQQLQGTDEPTAPADATSDTPADTPTSTSAPTQELHHHLLSRVISAFHQLRADHYSAMTRTLRKNIRTHAKVIEVMMSDVACVHVIELRSWLMRHQAARNMDECMCMC